MKRKIAAILAADIVGYSRLVGEDEEDTLRRLENYRAVFSDFIDRFGGRIFNTAGDAILAEFPSAVDAVRCAVDTQESLRTRNLAYPPSRQMNFRIGITIGDVVEREGDLLGEGVNIASRLEGIAPAGGICISRSVHEAVANKISLKFADVGEQQLKNLPDRVHAYTVTLEQPWTPRTRQTLQQLKTLATPVWGGLAVALIAALANGAYVIATSKHENAADTKDAVTAVPPKVSEPVIQPATAPPVEATAALDTDHGKPPDSPAPTSDKDEPTGESSKVHVSDEPLAGEWKGQLTENDGDTYIVVISIEREGKGTINYPKLKCSGTLLYLSRRGAAYVFKETITKGTKCGKTAEVELTVKNSDGSDVDYNWVGEGPKVTGSLSGSMTAGPGEDDCMKYLPNRRTMIRTPCKSEDNASDTPP